MRQKLESRRGALAALVAIKEEEKKLETQLTEARASQTFAVIGEVEHVSLPDVRRRRKAAEEAVERVGGLGTANVVGEEGRRSRPRRLDRHPHRQDARERGREAPQDGGAAHRPRRRSGRSGARRLPAPSAAAASGCVIRASRSARFSSSVRPGVGKTELGQGAGRVPLRRRGRHDPPRHERVHGEAHGAAAGRRAARLRRQRERRVSHRGRAPSPLLGAPLRRGREGALRRLQPAPPGARRRPPHRRSRPHRRLQQRRGRHDQQHRLAAHPRDLGEHVRVGRGARRPARRAPRRAEELPPPGVPQPHRRHHHLPPALPRWTCAGSSTSS